MAELTKVYETADGLLIRDKKTAQRHEAWLELVAKTESLLVDADDGTHEPPHPEEIAELIAADAEGWVKLLRRNPSQHNPGEADDV